MLEILKLKLTKIILINIWRVLAHHIEYYKYGHFWDEKRICKLNLDKSRLVKSRPRKILSSQCDPRSWPYRSKIDWTLAKPQFYANPNTCRINEDFI